MKQAINVLPLDSLEYIGGSQIPNIDYRTVTDSHLMVFGNLD